MRSPFLCLVLLCSLAALVAAWSKEDYEIFKLKDEVEAAEGHNVSFYDFLGITQAATFDDIKKAFKRKSRALHPDKVKHSFIASRSTPPPRKPGEKKKAGVHVSKGPSEREISRFVKQAAERYSRLGVVTNILKGPQRERYDYFLTHGFPAWRGTGYYYSRYRPGLGTVLVGLFLIGGGGAHYLALITGYKRQREFMDRYIRHARKAAWGDESGISGIAGLGGPVDVPRSVDEPESTANLNRRQKRELERQGKKEKLGKAKPSKATAVSSTATGEKRRVTAENGKILVVDSIGNVFLQEENEDGQVQEYLLDLDEIVKPTLRDTAVYRLPVWLYRTALNKLRKPTATALEDDSRRPGTPDPAHAQPETPPQAPVSEASQDSGFEIVDSTGIEKDMETAKAAATVKKRNKKAKK